jgi:hypothetical protein
MLLLRKGNERILAQYLHLLVLAARQPRAIRENSSPFQHVNSSYRVSSA